LQPNGRKEECMAKKKNEVAVVGPTGLAPAGAPAAAVPSGIPAAVIPPGSLPPFATPVPGYQQQAPPANAAIPQVVTGEVNASDFAMQLYLKGSDVPQEYSTFKVRVVAFVRIQGSRSPLVAQIDPAFGKQYLPLNKTNIKQLSALVGNNLQVACGKVLSLTCYPVNNPSSGQMSRGLYVTGVE
jgi:hypothetical protein